METTSETSDTYLSFFLSTEEASLVLIDSALQAWEYIKDQMLALITKIP